MKKRNKIISLILGISLFISSFKLEFKGILNRDEKENSKNETTTSTMDNVESDKSESIIKIDDEIYETTIKNEITETIKETEVSNEIENIIVEIENKIDIEITESTINQYEENKITTESQTIETENIEIPSNTKIHKNEIITATTARYNTKTYTANTQNIFITAGFPLACDNICYSIYHCDWFNNLSLF